MYFMENSLFMQKLPRNYFRHPSGNISLSALFSFLTIVTSIVPPAIAEAVGADSKTTAAEVSDRPSEKSRLLDEVIASPKQAVSSEGTKVRAEIMDDLEHHSEPEPFCYYPI